MVDELIQKIATRTGQPVETVAPIVGALLAHLGDVLPAPLAHRLAIMLGIHPDDGSADRGEQPATSSLPGNTEKDHDGGSSGGFAGATSLMNVAEGLLGNYLTKRG